MITSSGNARIKELSALIGRSRERRKRGLFVVEGPRMVAEAPEALLREVFFSRSFGEREENAPLLEELTGRDVLLEEVSDAVFKGVSDTQTPQGILAVVKMPEYQPEQLLAGEETMLLVLDGIQDPGNLGTMIRTGEGAGLTGVIAGKTTVDLYNPKTIRSTMGSIYRVPYLVEEELTETLDRLKGRGVKLFAAHLRGQEYYDDLDYTGPCAFLIGNEGRGLSEAVAERADCWLRIPMEGQVESLNAAVSAAILMYEAGRQRRKK